MRLVAYLWHRFRAFDLRGIAAWEYARARRHKARGDAALHRADRHEARADRLYPPPGTGPPDPRPPARPRPPAHTHD